MVVSPSSAFVAPTLLTTSTLFPRHHMRHVNRPTRTITRPARVIASAGPQIVPLADTLDSVPSEFRTSLLSLPEDAEIAALGARHVKIMATIGPSSCTFDNLLRLIAGGVNLIRLNLSHGDFEWHRQVIDDIRTINLTTPFVAAVMIDVGSFDSLRIGEFARNPILKTNDSFVLTVRHEPEYPDGVSEVSVDTFIDVVEPGDLLQCQAEGGGVVELLIKELQGPDVHCQVVSPGELRSRGTISIRGKSLNLTPARSGDDLNATVARAVLGCPPDHLEFAISQRVEYIGLSFVESPEQINTVKSLLRDRVPHMGVVAKIESANALRNLESIIDSADAIMVARGDLATSVNYQKVPYWQEQIAKACRRYGKPCLVSTHFLESMVLYPTPTRAEVTDMTEAAKQLVDGLVLTTETASGRFPFKSVSTMNTVLARMQTHFHEMKVGGLSDEIPPLVKDTTWWTPGVGEIAENIASAATDIANMQNAKAILVFTQKGLMATLTSRYRPKAPIYAFTVTPAVRNKLAMLYGVRPFRIAFEDNPEETIDTAMNVLKERKAIEAGDHVVVLADVLGGREGASSKEVRMAFDEVSKRNQFITAAEVRNGLRLLGLKVSDKLEARLGMGKSDRADADEEIKVVNENPIDPAADDALGRYDFERFNEFVSSAKEIVHTLQMRVVA